MKFIKNEIKVIWNILKSKDFWLMVFIVFLLDQGIDYLHRPHIVINIGDISERTQ